MLCRFSQSLCKEVLASWVSNIDLFGYISREQARGSEIIAMIPQEFVTQDAFEGNPPTLMLPLLQLLHTSDNASNIAPNAQFVRTLYPKLLAWYRWFKTT